MSSVTIPVEALFSELSDSPDEKWQDRALCAQTDPEAFFPEKGGSTKDARLICGMCEVREQCLQYALDHDERFGVWGGASERERRRMKREMTAAAAHTANSREVRAA